MAFAFDGQEVPTEPGDTFGSALHRAGILEISRSMKYHRPRGLFCVTGSCASCFVEQDGVPNVPACMTAAVDGADLRSQNRLGTARRDLLGITDKVYRRGLDLHGAFTRPRILNRAFIAAVRRMSGVGRAPKPDTTPQPRRLEKLRVDELIVGAGQRGLARALEAEGEVLLVDELPALGGSMAWRPEPDTQRLVGALQEAGVRTWTGALAFGVYHDTVGVVRGGDLFEVQAKRLTVAPGCHDAWPVFPNNDLPGSLSLRGAQRLLHTHGVLPGRRIVVHGDPLPDPFADALAGSGAEVVATGTVEAAAGGTRVERARCRGAWIDCDTIITNLRGTPRVELFQQAGCRLGFSSGVLAPVVDAEGRTTRADVYWGGA